jgi:hypothetical protein
MLVPLLGDRHAHDLVGRLLLGTAQSRIVRSVMFANPPGAIVRVSEKPRLKPSELLAHRIRAPKGARSLRSLCSLRSLRSLCSLLLLPLPLLTSAPSALFCRSRFLLHIREGRPQIIRHCVPLDDPPLSPMIPSWSRFRTAASEGASCCLLHGSLNFCATVCNINKTTREWAR